MGAAPAREDVGRRVPEGHAAARHRLDRQAARRMSILTLNDGQPTYVREEGFLVMNRSPPRSVTSSRGTAPQVQYPASLGAWMAASMRARAVDLPGSLPAAARADHDPAEKRRACAEFLPMTIRIGPNSAGSWAIPRVRRWNDSPPSSSCCTSSATCTSHCTPPTTMTAAATPNGWRAGRIEKPARLLGHGGRRRLEEDRRCGRGRLGDADHAHRGGGLVRRHARFLGGGGSGNGSRAALNWLWHCVGFIRAGRHVVAAWRAS